MKLLIDFGNTRCKWALASDVNLQTVSAFQYTNEDPTLRVEEVLQAIDFAGIEQIDAVSVLGPVFEQIFVNKLKLITSREVTFFRSQQKNYGVKLSYTNEHTYGADRYAALIGAHHRVSGDKVVLDCGTATTVDMIDASGVHAGGLIMPGVSLMVDSLANKTTGIPMNDANQAVRLLCNNTEQAVYSGCALMLQYGLNGIIQQLVENTGKQTSVLITGGASHLLELAAFANVTYIERPHLILEGLQVMQGN